MSAIRLRVHVPLLSPAYPGPTVLTRALNVLNRPPAPTPEQIRLAQIQAAVDEDVSHLLDRASGRTYSDTMAVLAFYWMLTIGSGYSPEHWTVLESKINKLLEDPSLSERGVLALTSAREWLGSARFAEPRKRVTQPVAAPFTSERFAPPLFATQSYLEKLLNEWLPQSILESYGKRVTEDSWGSQNAYAEAAFCLEEILRPRAVFPDLETVRRLDRIQKRVPTQAEELTAWSRRQQAGLEALVVAPARDASVLDPKLREILTDVVLYLLGVTALAPVVQPGRPWLFPAFMGTDLPNDLAAQVSDFVLPPDYTTTDTLLIPVADWPLASMWREHPISIQSSLLTPDGRIWDARSVAQEAGNTPRVVYRAIGRLEVKPTADGLVLTAPMGAFPREVSNRVSELTELNIYHRRWHIGRIEGLEGTIVGSYHVAQESDADATQRRSIPVTEEPLRWLRAS